MNTLAEQPLYQNAITQLIRLLEEARRRGGDDTSAASLATAGKDARPSIRTVNVAKVSSRGLVVFANSKSGKGQQMLQNPRAALCFYLPLLSQQVIIEGKVSLLPDSESNAAWKHRPRESALSHWASDQTSARNTEVGLQQRIRVFKRRFGFERVPRPPDWRAFEIQPDRIEFWRMGWEHLHSRILLQQDKSGIWHEEKLNP